MCPIKWHSVDHRTFGRGESTDEDVEVCLSVGWENYQGDEGLVKKCLEFIDPDFAGVEKDKFDFKAAEKALQKQNEPFEFTEEGKGGGGFDGYWGVGYQRKKTITKKKASKLLDSLFDGKLCTYPEGWVYCGVTPFDCDYLKGEQKKEKQEDLIRLKEDVSSILGSASKAERSGWSGCCHRLGGGNALLECEEIFLFSTEDGEKFHLQFKWSCIVKH